MERQLDLYVVYDRGQELNFYGELLGSGTSFADWKGRWFEVTIFKTEGGKYVVAGAGRSCVVHRPDCGQVAGRGAVPGTAEATAQPCEQCNPDLAAPVVAEVDREWAQVSDDPAAVIERLRLRDSEGVYYLPRTSADALRDAALKDDRLADVLHAPQHVA